MHMLTHFHILYMYGHCRRNHCIFHLSMIAKTYDLESAFQMLLTPDVSVDEVNQMLKARTMQLCFAALKIENKPTK